MAINPNGIIHLRRGHARCNHGASHFHTRQHGVLTFPLRAWLSRDSRLAAQVIFTQKWPSEDDFQIELLNTLYAITEDDFEAVHIPNGGHRAMATGRHLKHLGTRAGVYDLRCTWRGGDGELELKSKAGSAEPSQIEYGRYLDGIGKPNAVVYRICDAVKHLHVWGAPIKGGFVGIGNACR